MVIQHKCIHPKLPVVFKEKTNCLVYTGVQEIENIFIYSKISVSLTPESTEWRGGSRAYSALCECQQEVQRCHCRAVQLADSSLLLLHTLGLPHGQGRCSPITSVYICMYILCLAFLCLGHSILTAVVSFQNGGGNHANCMYMYL